MASVRAGSDVSSGIELLPIGVPDLLIRMGDFKTAGMNQVSLFIFCGAGVLLTPAPVKARPIHCKIWLPLFPVWPTNPSTVFQDKTMLELEPFAKLGSSRPSSRSPFVYNPCRGRLKRHRVQGAGPSNLSAIPSHNIFRRRGRQT